MSTIYSFKLFSCKENHITEVNKPQGGLAECLWETYSVSVYTDSVTILRGVLKLDDHPVRVIEHKDGVDSIELADYKQAINNESNGKFSN